MDEKEEEVSAVELESSRTRRVTVRLSRDLYEKILAELRWRGPRWNLSRVIEERLKSDYGERP